MKGCSPVSKSSVRECVEVASVNYSCHVSPWCWYPETVHGWQYVSCLAWLMLLVTWLYTGNFLESLGWWQWSWRGLAATSPDTSQNQFPACCCGYQTGDGDFATISRILQLISAILLPTVPVRDFRENVKPVKVSERLVKIIKHFDTTYYVFLRVYRFIWILLDFSHYRWFCCWKILGFPCDSVLFNYRTDEK